MNKYYINGSGIKNTTAPSIFKKPNKKRTGLKIIIAVVLLLAILVSVALSPIFNVKYVNVSGVSRLTKEQVISASGIKTGKNMFFYNCHSLKKRIKSLPAVLTANVKRELPSGFSIEITERVAMAYVSFIGSDIYIDEEGKIIEVMQSGVKEETAVRIIGITPTKFQLGEQIETESAESIEVLKSCMQAIKVSELGGKIEEINISRPDNITLVANKNKVIVGNTEELEYKFQFLAQILLNLRNDEHGTIDLTTAPNVLFRPNIG